MMCGTPDPVALQTCLWRVLEVVAAAGGAAGLAAATRLCLRARAPAVLAAGGVGGARARGSAAGAADDAGRPRRGKARRPG